MSCRSRADRRPWKNRPRDHPERPRRRYASADLVALWSPEEKIRMERRLWLAVLRAQRDLGVAVPDGVVEAYEAVVDQVDLASHRRPRAGHPARREGADRGVQRARRARAHPQGDDLPRPHRERRAAADPGVARADPRPGRRHPGPARRARRRALRPGHDRPVAQRRGAGHHARQAVRLGGRGAADRVRAARRPDRPLPAARHQGPGRHGRRPARPARRRRRASWPSWSSGSPRTSASTGC